MGELRERARAVRRPATVPISGNTAGRLDLEELDRAAVDGSGLVTTVWVAGNEVLTAYRDEGIGTWAAPMSPAAIDPGDGTPLFGPLTVASNAFGRALAAWTGNGGVNRYALRGPGAGAPWSTPQPIDGVPADAVPLDLAIDDTGRVAYVWGLSEGSNVQALAVSTYGEALGPPPTTTTTLPGGGSLGGAMAAGIVSSVSETKRFVTRLAKNSSIRVTVPNVPAPGKLRVQLFWPPEARVSGRLVARGGTIVKKAGRVRLTLQTVGRGRKLLKKVLRALAQDPSVSGLDLLIDVVFVPSGGVGTRGSAVATAPL